VVGLDDGVCLMTVPSFEVIHSISAGPVDKILPLLDGDSFMCCSNSQLIRYYTYPTHTNDNNKAYFKHQLFEGSTDGPVEILLQMRHDPQKLIVCCKLGRITFDMSYSVWDIKAATILFKLPTLNTMRTHTLFELGDSGLFVSFPSELSIWDLRGEGELLFETESRFDEGMWLRNDNILLIYRHKGIPYIEEHQVLR